MRIEKPDAAFAASGRSDTAPAGGRDPTTGDTATDKAPNSFSAIGTGRTARTGYRFSASQGSPHASATGL